MLRSIDSTTFTIAFAHVQLRGSRGRILKNRWAFVPAKYLAEFDVEAMREEAMRVCAERYGADSPAYARLIMQMGAADEA